MFGHSGDMFGETQPSIIGLCQEYLITTNSKQCETEQQFIQIADRQTRVNTVNHSMSVNVSFEEEPNKKMSALLS